MAIFKLKDARKLDYDIYGDPNGKPVIFCHGFSDSKLIRSPDEGLTISLGVKIIIANQPGVGESSPMPGRKMVDWGADMEELAEYLGLETFSVAGHSGGGPHALAIAHRLPKRVQKIALASPVLPFDYPGVTKLIRNRDLKLIAHLKDRQRIMKLAYKLGAKSTLKNVDAFIKKTAKDDPSDAAVYLGSPEFQKMFEASFTEGLAQQGEGLYEMTVALWDWGFDPKTITTETTMFYGDADNIIDPKMPQELASMLPNCISKVWHDAGHYGFLEDSHWKEFFNAV